MLCLFSQVLADQPTAAGVLYRCEVCGRGYRTRTSIDRVARECTGTAEQWATVRRGQAMEAVRAGVAPERLQAALAQVERCVVCSQYLSGCCRLYTCGTRWLRRIAAGECRQGER